MLSAATALVGAVLVGSASTPAVCDGGVQGLVLDRCGEALVGADLRLTAEGQTSVTSSSDGRGAYSFSRLCEGHYELRASLSGSVSQTVGLSLEAGVQRSVRVDFGLPLALGDDSEAGVVSGSVKDRAGVALGGVRINALPALGPSDVHETWSGEDGRYRLRLTSPGQYVVYAHKPGFGVRAHSLAVGCRRQSQALLFDLPDLAATATLPSSATSSPAVSRDTGRPVLLLQSVPEGEEMPTPTPTLDAAPRDALPHPAAHAGPPPRSPEPVAPPLEAAPRPAEDVLPALEGLLFTTGQPTVYTVADPSILPPARECAPPKIPLAVRTVLSGQSVRLRITVNEVGAVVDIAPLKGSALAVRIGSEYLRGCRHRPGTKDGAPVTVELEVALTFDR